MAAAFDLSYADLTSDQQRLFRRLGLHPGADIDGYAAAALDGTGLDAARRGLEALYDQCLLTEPAAGRDRMHDLIREHARALAVRIDPGRDRDQATGRLLDYYQHTAARADALITRQTRPAPAAAAGAIRPRLPAWPAGSRRWPGHAPSAPACSPAWTTPPPPASTPGSPLSPPRWPGCCAATARGPRPSPATQSRFRPPGTWVTGSAKPTLSTTSATCGA